MAAERRLAGPRDAGGPAKERSASARSWAATRDAADPHRPTGNPRAQGEVQASMPAPARATAVAACAALLAASAIALVAGGGSAGGSAGDGAATAGAGVHQHGRAAPATAARGNRPTRRRRRPLRRRRGRAPETLPTRQASGETVAFQRPDGVQLVGGGSPGRLDAGFVYAPGTGVEAVANVGSDGDGNTTTRVLVSDARTGDSVMVKMVPARGASHSPWRTVRPRAWPGAGRASSCRTSTTAAASPPSRPSAPRPTPILLAARGGRDVLRALGRRAHADPQPARGPDDTGEFSLTRSRSGARTRSSPR